MVSSSSSDDVTKVCETVTYDWLLLRSRVFVELMTSWSASELRNESDSEENELPFPVSKAESLAEDKSVGRSLLDWLDWL